jgi:hypothetical protein
VSQACGGEKVMKCHPEYFPSYGYLLLDFDDNDLQPIKKEISKIENKEKIAKDAQAGLLGHIKREYELESCKAHLSDLIMSSISVFKQTFGDPVYVNNILSRNVSYFLDKAWVNFQEKHEFNPLHDHTGIYSFVIWIQIPYISEDESKVFADIPAERKRNGNFTFTYTNPLGILETKKIDADKTFEGKGLLFPSMLNHSVYPFYTSDKYRISVSGNIKYKV